MRKPILVVAIASLAFLVVAFGVYRYVARNTDYFIQAHMCVDGFFDLVKSDEIDLDEVFGKRGNMWGRTIDGVTIEPSGCGVRFSTSGNYWNYEKKARTVRRLVREFAEQNPNLPFAKVELRILELKVDETQQINPPVVLEEEFSLGPQKK